MFSLQLAWNGLKGESLWAHFANGKYGGLSGYHVPIAASHIWKSVMHQMPRVQSLSHWVVGKGNIPFWSENWSGSILMGLRPVHAMLTVREAWSTLEHYFPFLTAEQHQQVRMVVLDPVMPDRLTLLFRKLGTLSLLYIGSSCVSLILKFPGLGRFGISLFQ